MTYAAGCFLRILKYSRSKKFLNTIKKLKNSIKKSKYPYKIIKTQRNSLDPLKTQKNLYEHNKTIRTLKIKINYLFR